MANNQWKCDRGEPPPRIPRERLACLAQKIHPLGERPLYELFVELDAGRELGSLLERYARLDRYAGFIQTLNGDRQRSPQIVAGGAHDHPFGTSRTWNALHARRRLA
jgi:hypothetical protein